MIYDSDCINFVFNSNTIIININTMKKIFSVLLLVPFLSVGQSAIEPALEDQFDVVAKEWITKSSYLKTFQGVNEYCQNPTFRKSVDRLLTSIHQYDSLILHKMEDPTEYLSWNKKEEKRTFADVHQLEELYGMSSFIDYMREACVFRNEIEKNAESLRNGVGYESYDSKVLLLETDMARYLKKIDKLILKIDDHLHVLHIN